MKNIFVLFVLYLASASLAFGNADFTNLGQGVCRDNNGDYPNWSEYNWTYEQCRLACEKNDNCQGIAMHSTKNYCQLFGIDGQNPGSNPKTRISRADKKNHPEYRCEIKRPKPILSKIPDGSYKLTCRNIRVDPALAPAVRLSATCKAINGKWTNSTLSELAACIGDIGNMNGVLACNKGGQPPSGSYQQSCPLYWRVYSTLHGYCKNIGYGHPESDLDGSHLSGINECTGDIFNNNGRLVCSKGGTPPSGSYRKSCERYYVDKTNNLFASCRRIDGSMTGALLKKYSECEGDIANMNGSLRCNRR